MKINLIVGFESPLTKELIFLKGIDENGNIIISKDRAGAKRISYNQETIGELVRISECMLKLCLLPVILFETTD